MHAMVDLDYLKVIELLGDALIPDVVEMMHGGLVDTGTDFYHRILDNDIPATWIPSPQIYDTVMHWGWLSSSNRDRDKRNANSSRDFTREMNKALHQQWLQDVLAEIHLPTDRLVQGFHETSCSGQIFRR
jgi:hypothetical protein